MTIQENRARAAVEAMPILPGNPIVFMEITVDGEPAGRLVFQLRKDVAPRTADNFEALCTGSAGFGYRASALHGGERMGRIFGGDFFGTGTGGYSIFGPTFPDEDLLRLQHLGPGTLAMRNTGPDSNNSQFYIALRALPEFDGLSQVAGYMTEGWDVLKELARLLRSDGRFNADVRIARCGVLHGYSKPAAAASDDEGRAMLASMSAAAAQTGPAARPSPLR